MAKELEKYSAYELYKELVNRDHVEVVMWVDDDIISALKDEDVEPSKENIQRVWDKLGHWLRDDQTQEGWQVIYAAISECDFDE